MKSLIVRQKYMFILLLILLSAIRSFAQEKEEPPLPFPERGPLFYYETVNLIADDTLKSRLDINVRISFDFLVSVKNPQPSFHDELAKRVETSVEIFDHNDVSVARDTFRKTIYTRESKNTTAEKEQFLDVNFSFDISPGTYKLVLEISDVESERKVTEKKEKIVLKDFHAKRLTISDPIFVSAGVSTPVVIPDSVKQSDSSALICSPMQIGGNIYFGKNADAYIEFTDIDSQPAVEYDLYKIRSQDDSEKGLIAGATFPVEHQLQGLSLQAGYSQYSFYYAAKRSPLKNKYSAVLHIRSDSLEQGLYELHVKVRDGQNTDSTLKAFQITWVDMPLSLRDRDFAIQSMRYITTDQEFDDLQSGSRERRWGKFNAFWKKRDPTPETAYNEVMAEYYKRVDYAYFNFNTLREHDGSKTDRGKIYILFGPPTVIERQFNPDYPPQEVWYYTNLNKKFVFVDESRAGNYKLSGEQ